MKISISGIRGIFGRDLSLLDIIRFNKKFVMLLKERGIERCIVARDTRSSSKVISEVTVATLLSFGIDVYNLGIAPTPFLFRESRECAGVMITSSHNPLEWNGLKFVINGRGLFEDELELMLSFNEPSYTNIGKEYSGSSNYIKDVLELGLRSNAKVYVDTSGGAATSYVESLLKGIGCKVYSLNYDKPDHPDPTTKDLTQLLSLVSSHGCDVGFALDLDGDRLVVVNNNGILSPDTTLLFAIAKIVEMGIAKEFAFSIDTSNSIRDFLLERGYSIVYSKVGEANLIKVMLDKGIEVGGEGSSGGFVFTRLNMCRDGLLATVFIASMINSNYYLECLKLSKRYSIVRKKLEVPTNLQKELINKISERLKRDSYQIVEIDGVKGYIDEHTWLLIRPSNTEDVVRISIESNNRYKLNKILKEYEEFIRSIVKAC